MTRLTQQLTRPSRFPSPGHDASSRLALELAMRIKPAGAVADEYGIPRAELVRRLKTDKAFQAQIAEYQQIWLHPTNAAERVRIKSAVLAEDGLHALWDIFMDRDINPGIRLDCHKHLAKLADVEPRRAAEDAQGSRFAVTINLPNVDPMEVVATVTDASEDASEPPEAIFASHDPHDFSRVSEDTAA